MLQQSDIEGRLRLFRYGLVTIVVISFLISLLIFVVAHNALVSNLTEEYLEEVPDLLSIALGPVLLVTVVVAVLAVAAYFGYQYILKRSVSGGDEG